LLSRAELASFSFFSFFSFYSLFSCQVGRSLDGSVLMFSRCGTNVCRWRPLSETCTYAREGFFVCRRLHSCQLSCCGCSRMSLAWPSSGVVMRTIWCALDGLIYLISHEARSAAVAMAVSPLLGKWENTVNYSVSAYLWYLI